MYSKCLYQGEGGLFPEWGTFIEPSFPQLSSHSAESRRISLGCLKPLITKQIHITSHITVY